MCQPRRSYRLYERNVTLQRRFISNYIICITSLAREMALMPSRAEPNRAEKESRLISLVTRLGRLISIARARALYIWPSYVQAKKKKEESFGGNIFSRDYRTTWEIVRKMINDRTIATHDTHGNLRFEGYIFAVKRIQDPKVIFTGYTLNSSFLCFFSFFFLCCCLEDFELQSILTFVTR